MSAYSAKGVADTYSHRASQHERRMLETYRSRVANDATQLQPLANACWRAASFEWTLHKEVETVRRLWTEAADVLAQGFVRRRRGFDPSPDQLILAFHFALAARARNAFSALALSASGLQTGVPQAPRAFRGARAHLHLAEGYRLLARELVERKGVPTVVMQLLQAAHEESDSEWWESQFPDALEVAWRMSEHKAVCTLLRIIARFIADNTLPPGDDEAHFKAEQAANEFALTIDAALLRLEQFVSADVNHHPKLNVWLPGIALCILARSAGLSANPLVDRYDASAPRYTRLPFELLR